MTVPTGTVQRKMWGGSSMGGRPIVPAIRRMTEIGIPVMGHLGFTPQSEVGDVSASFVPPV